MIGTKGRREEGTTDPMSNAWNNVFVKRVKMEDRTKGQRDE